MKNLLLVLVMVFALNSEASNTNISAFKTLITNTETILNHPTMTQGQKFRESLSD
ncbi:MAG: hypothetical protein KA715_07465 [Xanthomonadaceae bacterium]|nr:hypothetical protein [Xanthomonadaceae bacterium]